MRTINFTLWLLVILISVNSSFSQLPDQLYFDELNNQICGFEEVAGNYPKFPVDNDTLKILVVFARFPDDTWDPPYPNHATQYWPNSLGTNKPAWANGIIKPNTQNIGNSNMTAFFRDASFNKFMVIGDVYPDLYIFKNNSTYYAEDTGKQIGLAVKELLEDIDDNVDYSQYDKFAPNDPIDKRHPDGQVDFILIVFRFFLNTDAGTNSGYAGLGGTRDNFGSGITQIILDSTIIKARANESGVVSTQRTPWTYNIHAHELGHYLWSHHPYEMGLFNTMNRYGNSFPNAHEREDLGWSSPTHAPTTNSTILLKDYATTGEYIKITIGVHKYYFENRRRINYHFTPEWKVWNNFVYQPSTPLVPDSSLLIYKNTVTVESADGRWNFLKSLTNPSKYIVDEINKGIYLDRFFYDTPNKFNGETIFNLRNKDGVSYYTGEFLNQRTERSINGDTNVCFDIGYNQVYSPWSNPGVKVNFPSDSFAVEIIGKTTDGDLIIKVYFENLTESAPSKPQYLHTNREYLGYPPNAFYPRISWNRNTEPDISQYKLYKGVISTPGLEPSSYNYVGITSDTTYLDQTQLLYRAGSGGICPNLPITYSYKVSAVDLTNKESCKSENDSISGYFNPCLVDAEGPDNFSHEIQNDIVMENELSQNYPNPFNPITIIKYSIKEASNVKIKIYDISGKEILSLVNEFKEPGHYNVSFNGSNMASGIYYYKIFTGNYVSIKKMLLIK